MNSRRFCRLLLLSCMLLRYIILLPLLLLLYCYSSTTTTTTTMTTTRQRRRLLPPPLLLLLLLPPPSPRTAIKKASFKTETLWPLYWCTSMTGWAALHTALCKIGYLNIGYRIFNFCSEPRTKRLYVAEALLATAAIGSADLWTSHAGRQL